MEEEYRTLKASATAEFTERRSRFLSDAAPVCREEEATAFLQSVKSRHKEARHYVYAYCLRQERITRHSDGGEPQGTAGMPVLDVLLRSGVTDAMIVVTRYFGGILLGAGGLVRAYSHAASLALKQSGIAVMKRCALLEICCGYAQYAAVSALIARFGGAVDHTEYRDSVRICFHLEQKKLNLFCRALSDATCGKCRAELLSEKYRSVQ